MLRSVAAFMLGLSLVASATAQAPPNPVMEHFRAYRAALAQGDFTAADTAAAAALAASEARDGDGGRTAILALNLASLRLERGDRAGALQPAQRAHGLATSRGDANVDPTLTRLVAARAALSDDGAQKDELQAAIAAAASNEALAGDVYLAAIDLGRQELADRRYARAAAAWGVAAAHADAAPSDPIVARANALTLEAVSFIYVSNTRNISRARDPEINADDRLHEAMRLTRPDLRTNASSVASTDMFRSYATARAWHSALGSRLASIPFPQRDENSHDIAPLLPENRCVYRVDPDPVPRYPRDSLAMLEVGTVIAVFHMDANGAVTRREIIASAPPNSDFEESVRRHLQRWRVTISEDSPPDCAKETVMLSPITFRVSD